MENNKKIYFCDNTGYSINDDILPDKYIVCTFDNKVIKWDRTNTTFDCDSNKITFDQNR